MMVAGRLAGDQPREVETLTGSMWQDTVMARALLLMAAVMLAGCGLGRDAPTVIEGSSRQAFEQTLAEAKSELGPSDRIKFETALAEYRAQMFARADTRQEYQRLFVKG